MAGDGEVVLHDERDHLRGVLGGNDMPWQSEGHKCSSMYTHIFYTFAYPSAKDCFTAVTHLAMVGDALEIVSVI